MDRQDTKTVQYSNVDAVNRAINAVAMSNVSNAMYGAKGKPWMRRTTLSFQFQRRVEAAVFCRRLFSL